MDKQTIIQKHFQKVDRLTITNEVYRKCVDDLCEWFLKNDKVQHDTTTKLLFSNPQKEIHAKIFAKQDLTLAGLTEVVYLLETFTDIHPDVKAEEGSHIKKGQTMLELRGNPAEILAYERTILNFMQRLSGIASATNEMTKNIAALGLAHPPLIAATRKTQWTLLDKKAVALGGGGTHRLNLADGVLVKDNHLLILNEFFELQNEADIEAKTFELIAQKVNETLIEFEVEQKESIEALIKASVAIKHTNTLCIMLDNFTPSDAKKILDEVREKYDVSHIVFEASGGINKNNILDWAKTGVDVISLGALTHSTQAVDMSLEII